VSANFKERGEQIEKGKVVHRKEGKGEAEKDKKIETEEGRRGYMKIDKKLLQRHLVSVSVSAKVDEPVECRSFQSKNGRLQYQIYFVVKKSKFKCIWRHLRLCNVHLFHFFLLIIFVLLNNK